MLRRRSEKKKQALQIHQPTFTRCRVTVPWASSHLSATRRRRWNPMQLDNVNVAVERCKPIYISSHASTQAARTKAKRYPCFLHRVRLTLSIPSLIGALRMFLRSTACCTVDVSWAMLLECQWNAWNPSRALKRRNVARPIICHTSDASCPCHGHDGLQSMDSWLPLAYRSQCCNRVCSVD